MKQKPFVACPFCDDTKGLYVGDSPLAHPSLRYQVECVCGATGAPRATPEAATEWWNTRKTSSVPAGNANQPAPLDKPKS